MPEKPLYGGHGTDVVPSIVWAFNPSLCALLNVQDGVIDIPSFLRPINDGKVLFKMDSRSVVQLNDEVVVKIGNNIAHEEPPLLDYVARHTSIRAPRPLGLVTFGSTSYMFTTFIPGDTLEKRWPSLTATQKESVRGQLDLIMSELRRHPHAPSASLGTLGTPQVCKDYRISVSTSPPDVHSISAFHDWLVSTIYPQIGPSYRRWLRSRLRDDYRVMLTHGDFHPRNIMVEIIPSGDVRVTGVIDWEMGGWYPEYWEMYKALNTRDPREESDWWDMLPPCISGYDTELVELRLLEQSRSR